MRDANLAAGLGTGESNHVVYSGMDLLRFRTATPSPEAPRGPMIAFVAALEPRKRHGEFLGVFARLAQNHPALTLCLLGQGPEEDRLRALANDLGLGGRVLFPGFRPDVERWIAAADLCVLPSMREGLPRVVVQYLAAGKPVVVTHLEGIEEIVEDGVTGFVVGHDDFDGMGAAIARLLDDPDRAAAMGAAARTRDLSRWSVERMEPAVDAILREIILRKAVALPDAAPPRPARTAPRAPVGASSLQRN
jgi:glycosyltransferase involved in cell wall biosynthesis